MAQGEKVFKSVQAGGLANARKELRKTCGPFRLTGVKNPHTIVRKVLPYVHQRQKFQFVRQGNV